MEPKRIELTYDMIKNYVPYKGSLYAPYIWDLREDPFFKSLEGTLYAVTKLGELKIIGKKTYKTWNDFLSLKDYEYADYVFVYKKDNKWYYMDTCKKLELKLVEDE